MKPLRGIFLIPLFLQTAHAGLVQFSTFSAYNTNPIYTWTNNNNNTSPQGTLSSSADVYFTFLPGSVPVYALTQALPVGPVHAILSRTSTSTAAATCTSGGGPVACGPGTTISQNIGTGSIVFTLYGTSSVLLSINGAANAINGAWGSTVASFGATLAGGSFSFSSDYINFTQTDQLDRSVALSTIVSPPGAVGQANTGLTVGADGLLNSFTSQATGGFSAEFVQTPEPATLATMGLALALIGLARRRVNR